MGFSALLFLMVSARTDAPADLLVYVPKGHPQLDFAAGEVASALASKGKRATVTHDIGDKRVWCGIEWERGAEEGFRLSRQLGGWRVIGGDVRGAMYGGLELSQQIRL